MAGNVVGEPNDLEQGSTLRNEFSAVTLRLQPYGRGNRLEVRSTLYGTAAYLDATILEALSRMSRATLQGLVSLSLLEWDAREDGHAPPAAQ